MLFGFQVVNGGIYLLVIAFSFRIIVMDIFHLLKNYTIDKTVE